MKDTKTQALEAAGEGPIVIRQCKCGQCSHVWLPRKPGSPEKCPRCQSFAWKTSNEPSAEATAENGHSERPAA
jgi:predicted Zn-ribbon and HTH transcriptional regulator